MGDNSSKQGGDIEHSRELFDVLIAEFNATRQELIYRSQAADRFAVLVFALITALLGLGLTHENALMLMIPILAPLLGVLYLNQLHHVVFITGYIREKIAPVLSAQTGNNILQYEDYLIKNRRRFSLLGINFLNASVPFIASVIALILTCEIYSPFVVPCRLCTMQIVWSIGVVFTVLFLIFWIREERGLPDGKCRKQISTLSRSLLHSATNDESKDGA